MSSMYMPAPTIAYTAARLDRKVGGADSNGKDPGARERVLLSRSSQVNVGGVSPVRVSEEGYGAFSLLLPLSVSSAFCPLNRRLIIPPQLCRFVPQGPCKKAPKKHPKALHPAALHPAPFVYDAGSSPIRRHLLRAGQRRRVVDSPDLDRNELCAAHNYHRCMPSPRTRHPRNLTSPSPLTAHRSPSPSPSPSPDRQAC